MPSQPKAGQLITSRNHPALRRIRALHARPEREQTGLFLIDGMRLLAQAAQHRIRFDTLVVAPALLHHAFAKKLVRQIQRTGVPYLEVTPEVLHSVAQSDNPQGVAAVVQQEWTPIAQADPQAGLCWLAVTQVQSCGNLGTLIRTCEAVGAAGVILLSPGPDPYDPACVRASMGSLFALQYVRTTVGEFLRWKERCQGVLVGTSPTAAVDYQEANYPRPTILFMGWEREGMSAEEQNLCNLMVRIPMAGRCDSLNLAVASSVMLYEVFNQHRRAPTFEGEPV
jgi:TrmH family RNA methyltransferase